MRTTRAQIKNLFKALRVDGMVARMSYLCCSGCAAAALDAEYEDGREAVYFHRQDAEAFVGGALERKLHLRFGIVGAAEQGEADAAVARKVVRRAREMGIPASWCGDVGTCIMVAPTDEVPSVPAHDEKIRCRHCRQDYLGRRGWICGGDGQHRPPALDDWLYKEVGWGDHVGVITYTGRVSGVSSGTLIIVHGQTESPDRSASGIVHRTLDDVTLDGRGDLTDGRPR